MVACITLLMEGSVSDEEASAFLTILYKRGETSPEITGAARVLRNFASTIDAPEGAIDCCGTGGDGLKTYNISTAVALVAAACGVPIAKHGNRSASSQSGAADVLEKLGVDLSLPKKTLENSLRDLNFCFLMAPHHHAAMRHMLSVRKALGHRTIFNLLGPLANPAKTKKQLLGVFEEKWVFPIAESLRSLGTERAFVVHGSDGLDEITLTGPTHAAILKDGNITQKTLSPQDFGLHVINGEEIKGGTVDENADALLNVLNGGKNAYRQMVLANTAAVLNLHDDRPFYQGVQTAAEVLDTGKALNVLNTYKELHA